MDNRSVQRILSTVLVGCLLSWTGSVSADTLLANFDIHPLPEPFDIYGSWPSGTLTPGLTSYNVQAADGFGGQWNGLAVSVDATGETDIEFEVTVNVSDPVSGLGVVLALVDGDGTEHLFVINTVDNTWFGLLPGSTYLLTVPLSGATGLVNPGTTPGLDLSNIIGFHMQVDTGGILDPYDISFENLRLFVPSAAIDGDLNLDGFVGVDDLNIVLLNWNQNVTPGDLGTGDPSGDGFVGVDDLNVVLVNWNNGTPPAGGAAIPEPASLALLGLGGVAMLRRRR